MKYCNFPINKLLFMAFALTTFPGYSSEAVYPIKFKSNSDDVSKEKNDSSKAVDNNDNTLFSRREKESIHKQIAQTKKTELNKDFFTQKPTIEQSFNHRKTHTNKPSESSKIDNNIVTYKVSVYSDTSKSVTHSQTAPVARSVGRSPNKSNSYDSSRAITLKATVDIVMNWHPIIKRSESELQQYEEHIREVKSAYYPTVNVGIKSGFEENQSTRDNNTSSKVVVNGSQMLYDFGKTKNKVELAEFTSAHSVSNLHKTINDIANETANAYLQVVRYKKLVDIAKKQVDGFKSINEIAKKRAGLGASAESDYSQAKVRLASSESLLHDYEAQLSRWSSILNNLANQKIASKIRLSFPDDIYGVCYSINSDAVSSPNIDMAQAQFDMAKAQIEATEAEYFPTISLNPTYEYQLEDEAYSSSRDRKKGKFGVFINVSAPIYEGGITKSRAKQAKQALHAAKYNLETEKTEAKRKIVEATSQIQSTKYSLDAKQIRETEAIKTRDLYKLQYIELGSRSFSDLLSAESEIHQTRMDIVNNHFTISSFSIECLYQSGTLNQMLSDRRYFK